MGLCVCVHVGGVLAVVAVVAVGCDSCDGDDDGDDEGGGGGGGSWVYDVILGSVQQQGSTCTLLIRHTCVTDVLCVYVYVYVYVPSVGPCGSPSRFALVRPPFVSRERRVLSANDNARVCEM